MTLDVIFKLDKDLVLCDLHQTATVKPVFEIVPNHPFSDLGAYM